LSENNFQIPPTPFTKERLGLPKIQWQNLGKQKKYLTIPSITVYIGLATKVMPLRKGLPKVAFFIEQKEDG
jgi:hypothetical protein